MSSRPGCSSLRSRTKAKAARRLLTASRGSNPPRLETNLMMRASCRSRGSTWMATRAMGLPRLRSGEGNDGRTEGRKSTPTPWNLAGQRGCRLGFRIVIGLSEFVLRLLQEPILTSSLSHSSFQECPLSSKFRAMQGESHDAVAERHRGVGSFRSDHLKFAEVPYDDFARPIFPFGEGFLEQKVVERMVLNMNREALHIRIFAWPLRHRPGDERRANFQPEVIVETPGPVLLDDESRSRDSGSRSELGDGAGGHGDDPEEHSGFFLLEPLYCSAAGSSISTLWHRLGGPGRNPAGRLWPRDGVVAIRWTTRTLAYRDLRVPDPDSHQTGG